MTKKEEWLKELKHLEKRIDLLNMDTDQIAILTEQKKSIYDRVLIFTPHLYPEINHDLTALKAKVALYEHEFKPMHRPASHYDLPLFKRSSPETNPHCKMAPTSPGLGKK